MSCHFQCGVGIKAAHFKNTVSKKQAGTGKHLGSHVSSQASGSAARPEQRYGEQKVFAPHTASLEESAAQI